MEKTLIITVLCITFFFSFLVFEYQNTQRKLVENGYCKTTLIGTSQPEWTKCK